tara:strand:+ start:374 stop:676 length:303 start_codon:yes stop_codon:yes gene_type:complete
MRRVETTDLFQAAFLKVMGATVEAIEVRTSRHGTVVLDVEGVSSERIASEGHKFAEQMESLVDPIDLPQVELRLENTLMASVFSEYLRLKDRILRAKRTN